MIFMQNYTPLHIAVLKEKVKAVELMLEKGANPNVYSSVGLVSVVMHI